MSLSFFIERNLRNQPYLKAIAFAEKENIKYVFKKEDQLYRIINKYHVNLKKVLEFKTNQFKNKKKITLPLNEELRDTYLVDGGIGLKLSFTTITLVKESDQIEKPNLNLTSFQFRSKLKNLKFNHDLDDCVLFMNNFKDLLSKIGERDETLIKLEFSRFFKPEDRNVIIKDLSNYNLDKLFELFIHYTNSHYTRSNFNPDTVSVCRIFRKI